jgi:hypothetical protein
MHGHGYEYYDRYGSFRIPRHVSSRSHTVDEPLAVHVFDNKVIIITRKGEVTEVPR